MNDWDTEQYLKFKDERTQPSRDLVSKIIIENPKSIIDLGCGPGNSTKILIERWPKADIIGLDKSPTMIERAKKDLPGRKWLFGNISKMKFRRKFDIVFSNATIHWIPGHDILLKKLLDISKPEGILAIQIPNNFDSPLHKILSESSNSPKWKKYTSHLGNIFTFHNAEYYYDLLSPLTKKIDIWETKYSHILNSHNDLIEWYKGTSIKMHLECLPNESSRMEFQKEILEKCIKENPLQKDGKLIYPFKRLFFIAYK